MFETAANGAITMPTKLESLGKVGSVDYFPYSIVTKSSSNKKTVRK
jgi:hypothetical protein